MSAGYAVLGVTCSESPITDALEVARIRQTGLLLGRTSAYPITQLRGLSLDVFMEINKAIFAEEHFFADEESGNPKNPAFDSGICIVK
jgi:hypothetical protein